METRAAEMQATIQSLSSSTAGPSLSTGSSRSFVKQPALASPAPAEQSGSASIEGAAITNALTPPVPPQSQLQQPSIPTAPQLLPTPQPPWGSYGPWPQLPQQPLAPLSPQHQQWLAQYPTTYSPWSQVQPSLPPMALQQMQQQVQHQMQQQAQHQTQQQVQQQVQQVQQQMEQMQKQMQQMREMHPHQQMQHDTTDTAPARPT
mmetsp:Transcript_43650/g.120742  ORF Transcript_43650/g.120742 Transcript_43650/m.120742 type:complete len:204 (+) Transcript_43650:1279-1890(+)|eukprot:4217709-Prymnesium_polylepis.2